MMGRAELLKNEGNARKAAGDLAGAAEQYRAALQAEPEFQAALYNLGVVLRELEELAEAEACFRRLLAVNPTDVEALFNLGALLRGTMRLAEAGQVLRRAVELAPDNSHLLLYLGQVGIDGYSDDSLRDAERCLRKAIQLQPDLADAHHCLGTALELGDRPEEALRAHLEALRLQPENAAYRSAVLTQKQRLCDWDGLDALCAQVSHAATDAAGPAIPPFCLLSIPSTPHEQLAAAQKYARSILDGVARERERLRYGNSRPRGARRRIGYLSAEFHEHATAYLAAELFELHDRNRFEIAAYSYGPAEASPMRARLLRGFDRFVDIAGSSDAQAARAIHADGVEILVDLKGYTFRARPGILALRPAPIQVSYLGYPGTMGADFIDYLVGDAIVTPHDEHYTEKLILMPGSYQVNDRNRKAASPPSREALELPRDAMVFCSFNQPYKISPQVFKLWMRILAATPGSVLWLLEFNAGSLVNLRREAASRGIDPGRLVAAPRLPQAEHLARLSAADLFLDTLPYNAHTTASDALWAGVPVLTCPGDTFPSRVAASLLRAVDLPELVAGSAQAYEETAVRLAHDRDALASLGHRLRSARSRAGSLFDTPVFVRHLEMAFEHMLAMHEAGRPATRLSVQNCQSS
jgi:protein O-GlcNAc transferase